MAGSAITTSFISKDKKLDDFLLLLLPKWIQLLLLRIKKITLLLLLHQLYPQATAIIWVTFRLIPPFFNKQINAYKLSIFYGVVCVTNCHNFSLVLPCQHHYIIPPQTTLLCPSSSNWTNRSARRTISTSSA